MNASKAARGRRASAGFTLLELMVVVTVIAIMAVIAIPNLSAARNDQKAYDDAGAIMQLFRAARMRAIGRGSAVLVTMTATSSDRGTFQVWEAVGPAPDGSGPLPRNTCKSPTSWTSLNSGNTSVLYLDGFDLNRPLEVEIGIKADVYVYSNSDGTATSKTAAYICFTPGGRMLLAPSTTPSFDGALPNTAPVEIRVSRGKGLTRGVLLPPNGVARLVSR